MYEHKKDLVRTSNVCLFTSPPYMCFIIYLFMIVQAKYKKKKLLLNRYLKK